MKVNITFALKVTFHFFKSLRRQNACVSVYWVNPQNLTVVGVWLGTVQDSRTKSGSVTWMTDPSTEPPGAAHW